MRKYVAALIFSLASNLAQAQYYYPAGGYVGVPYTGGYLVSGTSYALPVVPVMGYEIVPTPALIPVSPVPVAVPVYESGYFAAPYAPARRVAYTRPIKHVRSVCPSGNPPFLRPMYDAYGTFLGKSVMCY